MTDLIKVTQLPVIEEQLRGLKDYVDKTVADAMALVCTEETVQSVKKTRADLNRTFGELESQRKSVKTAVLAPYEQFEAVYKECVADAFRKADADLKQKVVDVESTMKRRCEDALREYHSELCEAYHIDFVPFERLGIVVSMTDAKAKTQPPKKLKDHVSHLMSGVAQSVELINSMGDDADEIMVEFKQCLDVPKAIAAVQTRRRMVEAEKAAKAAREAEREREAAAIKKVEAFAPPVVQEAPKTGTVTFTVTDTIERLKMLKQFLVTNGYTYE